MRFLISNHIVWQNFCQCCLPCSDKRAKDWESRRYDRHIQLSPKKLVQKIKKEALHFIQSENPFLILSPCYTIPFYGFMKKIERHKFSGRFYVIILRVWPSKNQPRCPRAKIFFPEIGSRHYGKVPRDQKTRSRPPQGAAGAVFRF